MNNKQREWIEKRDERFCLVLQDAPVDCLEMEAHFWCGEQSIKFDADKLKRLVPLLKEYGKSEALINAIRQCWKDWRPPPPLTPEQLKAKSLA